MLRALLLGMAMLMTTPVLAGPFGHFARKQCPLCCNYVCCKLDRCSQEYLCECNTCQVCFFVPRCVPCKICPPKCMVPQAPSCGCEVHVPGEPTPAPPQDEVTVQPVPTGNNTVPILTTEVTVQPQPDCANGQCNTVQQRGLININRQGNTKILQRLRRR